LASDIFFKLANKYQINNRAPDKLRICIFYAMKTSKNTCIIRSECTHYAYILLCKAKKKNMCVYCHMSKKSRVGRLGLFYYYYFFNIIDKTGNSRSRFRYLIFENSGKMTNYAVFLPSLLSISTKS
jgi:hypothetical protein